MPKLTIQPSHFPIVDKNQNDVLLPPFALQYDLCQTLKRPARHPRAGDGVVYGRPLFHLAFSSSRFG